MAGASGGGGAAEWGGLQVAVPTAAVATAARVGAGGGGVRRALHFTVLPLPSFADLVWAMSFCCVKPMGSCVRGLRQSLTVRFVPGTVGLSRGWRQVNPPRGHKSTSGCV